MRKGDLIKLSLRNFRARTGRTALTIFGMGIGIGSIIFLLGLGYGLQNALLSSITNSQSLLTLEILPDTVHGADISTEKNEEFSHLAGVASVIPAYDVSAQIKYKGIVSDSTATLSDPDFMLLEGKKILKGVNFEEGNDNEIVLSTAFSKIFQYSPDEMLGQNVNLSFRLPNEDVASARSGAADKLDIDKNFQIVGIFQSDELNFFMNRKNISYFPSYVQPSRVNIECKDTSSLERIKQDISGAGYIVSSPSDTVNNLNHMFSVGRIVLGIFGLIALFVSAIGMFNTMTVALLERAKEIGIMRSIGASKTDILYMFFIEATAMGFLGGVSGIVIGFALGSVCDWFVNLLAVYFGGQAVSLFHYPVWFIFFVLAFSAVIGFATGMVPARRAGSIEPLDAIISR